MSKEFLAKIITEMAISISPAGSPLDSIYLRRGGGRHLRVSYMNVLTRQWLPLVLILKVWTIIILRLKKLCTWIMLLVMFAAIPQL